MIYHLHRTRKQKANLRTNRKLETTCDTGCTKIHTIIIKKIGSFTNCDLR